ncbi:hypothetical protein [Pandoraea anhela]|uniref:hypothetical protein n=1 Tax=Pandoraea anhela TaxID=2508295 RepID=UPI0012413B87|nr:hypothetical protein [Pandoraea anhela]
MERLEVGRVGSILGRSAGHQQIQIPLSSGGTVAQPADVAVRKAAVAAKTAEARKSRQRLKDGKCGKCGKGAIAIHPAHIA